MKKVCILILLILLAALSACLPAIDSDSPSVEGSLETLMQRIYEGADLQYRPELANTVITADNARYFLGSCDIPLIEGLASEAVSCAVPHSVCLLRLPADADAASVIRRLRQNANPNKWVSVGVTGKNVVADGTGDLVILIMANEATRLRRSFLSLGA